MRELVPAGLPTGDKMRAQTAILVDLDHDQCFTAGWRNHNLCLYQAAIDEERDRLMESAQSQARLIEAVARFDAVQSADFPEGSSAATISQIVDAHKNFKGVGETGEFTLARREGEQIVFLLSHRHQDLEDVKPVPWDSQLAQPMRLALSGFSGTVIAVDYRGERVLAAHEPVAELELGIVAKIDLAEVRAPFIQGWPRRICLGTVDRLYCLAAILAN